MTLKDSEYIAIAKKARGDLRRALNILEGGNNETAEDKYWASMTFDRLLELPKEDRIMLAFKGDPDVIFGKLFEMVKAEKRWQYLTSLADCQSKMNMSVHKTVFLASLLEKMER
jgi:DNA polymerase III delta prime subunit